MIDVNFGNKTIIAGLAMAFILAYGMVNFNSGTPNTDFAFPKAHALTHEEDSRADQEQPSLTRSLDAEALPALQQSIADMSPEAKDKAGIDRRKW